MFSNYFFLKRLAAALNDRLTGMSLLQIFSQNKNELILGFASANKEFWIRTNLDPNISLISFPPSFSRARKNSVDLFKDILGRKVVDCTPFNFERSFQIELEDNYAILFKMHGRRANILISSDHVITALFRKNLTSDADLRPQELHKNIRVDAAAFKGSHYEPTSLIPALGREVRIFWNENFSDHQEDQKWNCLEGLLRELEHNSIKLLDGDTPSISLLPQENFQEQTSDPIYASNWLYERKTKSFYVDKEKNQILSDLRQQIRKSESYILKTSGKLQKVKNQRSPEEVANILMANLHIIVKGLSKVTLPDFYTNELIEIKLNPLLSAQKNAENYYRKSKNRHQEIEILEKNIKLKEKAIESISIQILTVESLEDIKEIRKFSRKSAGTNSQEKNEKSVPYHQFEKDGWEILVGRNAKANDELTLKVANKNDLWLHAKDVSGSHVVIKQQPGQNFPNHVIEYAAAIAAFNSKRKTDSLCPVIVTPKKFVRKIKGALPGQVLVAKEEVVMVKPLNEADF